jgi:hypothetical protein
MTAERRLFETRPKMSRSIAILRSLVHAGVLFALLLAPMALVTHVNAGNRVVIEAPAPVKNGMGLILLVSLQRA